MGSPSAGSGRLEETYRWNDENQVKVVLSRGFWLGKYEVTQGQWTALMGSHPWIGHQYSFYVKEAESNPATFVTWEDADQFCQELTNEARDAGRIPNGWHFMLPTEAQWEYACRAGTKTPFHFGKSALRMDDFEWYTANAFDAGEKYAHPVGEKQGNRWGLHDMHGNVSEWCRDWYRKSLPGGTNPEITEGGTERVFRGGSWADPARDCRSACRHHYEPEIHNYVLGFRIAIVQTEPLS
jgi:formylglycine-generating enzyme required for sulfatase activity